MFAHAPVLALYACASVCLLCMRTDDVHAVLHACMQVVPAPTYATQTPNPKSTWLMHGALCVAVQLQAGGRPSQACAQFPGALGDLLPP